jgi:hypothetical protein
VKNESIALFRKEIILRKESDFGPSRYPFEFVLPPDAPPTAQTITNDSQEGYGAGIKWVIHAKLDVPMGRDANAYKKIFVE